MFDKLAIYWIKFRRNNFYELEVLNMAVKKLLNPLELKLDMNNPRFSLFNFKDEEKIVEYLFNYEDVKSLAIQIMYNGYLTLGERLIVRNNSDNSYTVLEGNRRVAAIKSLFTYKYLFKGTKYEKKLVDLEIRDFLVDCDVVNEEEVDAAQYKIISKHIDGFTSWNPTDKRVYYDKIFSKYLENGLQTTKAIEKIFEITPESKYKIKKAIIDHRFLVHIYQATEKKYGNLPKLSYLESDVLISRVKGILTKKLSLTVDDNLYLKCEDGKDEIFDNILQILGTLTWIDKKLTTRKVNKNVEWDAFIHNEAPELGEEIEKYVKWDVSQNIEKKKHEDDQKTSEKKQTATENKHGGETKTRKQEDISKTSEKEQVTARNNHGKDANTDKYDDQKNTVEYKISIVERTVNVKKEKYDLRNNIKLVDGNGNTITKETDIYKKINFTVEGNNNDIFIRDNIILPISKNGIYRIIVSFGEIEKSYIIRLNVQSRRERKPEEEKHFFSNDWFMDAQALLYREEYHNIVSVLKCLKKYRDTPEDDSEIIVITLLIRTLIEYASKAYSERFIEKKPENGSLQSYVKNVAGDLYNKGLMTKEVKKTISAKDLEVLNGKIHDYTAYISLVTAETIFKSYKIYLMKIFKMLNKDS